MKMRLSLVLAWLLLLMPAVAAAQVGISPQLQDIALDGPARTYSFRLINYTKVPKRVAVTVSNWTMDASGTIATAPTTEQSLDPWIEINPTQFTIPAGESQVVRFAIRPAVPLSPGEHRAMVFFAEQPLPGEIAKPATLRVLFRIGAAIYAHVGPVHADGQVDAVTVSARGATFTLQSTGNATARMHGQYALWQSGPYPGAAAAISPQQVDSGFAAPKGLLRFGMLPLDAVLPDATRTAQLDFGKTPLPPGHYVLRLQGTMGSVAISRELHFDIPAGTVR